MAAAFALCVLSAAVCSSCYARGYTSREEKAVTEAGKTIILEHLADGATVDEIRADHNLDSGSMRLELSGLVFGKFTAGGVSGDFCVNTSTGSVYTSEKNTEYLRVAGLGFMSSYGIEYTDADTAGTVSCVDGPTGTTLSGMLPADCFGLILEGMDPGLDGAVSAARIAVLYAGSPMGEQILRRAGTGSAEGISVQICRTEPGLAHPEEHSFGLDPAIALESLLVEKGRSVYREYAVCSDFQSTCNYAFYKVCSAACMGYNF